MWSHLSPAASVCIQDPGVAKHLGSTVNASRHEHLRTVAAKVEAAGSMLSPWQGEGLACNRLQFGALLR